MFRRSRLILFAAAVAGMHPAFGQAPQRLTLKEAEGIALQNHPQIQTAQFLASAADQVVRENRSDYYPMAFGSLTGAMALHDSRIGAGGLNNPIIYNRYANGVGVSQLITDFGRTKNLVQSSDLHARAQHENVATTRADVLLQVDQGYYAALRAQAVLKVAEETVSARQLVSDQVTALAAGNLKSGLDVSFANVNLSEAKLLLVQAQNDVQAAFAQLSAALGYAEQKTFELVEEPNPSPPPADPSTLIVQALRDRPELAAQRLNVESAGKFATAERDLYLPTISAIGTAGLIPAGQEVLSDRYAAAGLNINIPIFNGHLFSAFRAEADLKARAESQSLRDLQDRVTRDVRLAWLNASAGFQRLALTAELLDQASKAMELSQARYNLGLGSIVELSQAQLNKTQAEIVQASAKYDYQAQIASLNYQIGLLR